MNQDREQSPTRPTPEAALVTATDRLAGAVERGDDYMVTNYVHEIFRIFLDARQTSASGGEVISPADIVNPVEEDVRSVVEHEIDQIRNDEDRGRIREMVELAIEQCRLRYVPKEFARRSRHAHDEVEEE